MRLASSIASALLLLCPPALAQSITDDLAQADRAVFGFAGRLTDKYFEYSFNPFTVTFENNYIVGGGYQQFFLGPRDGFRLGIEAGLAARLGEGASGEAWAGVVGRYDGFVIADTLRITPALTVGLSVVTGTMGIEARREREVGGSATLLFYLGPELDFSLVDHPNVEVFMRIQHRSGAWETLGNLRDGANANVIGARWTF